MLCCRFVLGLGLNCNAADYWVFSLIDVGSFVIRLFYVNNLPVVR